MLPAAICVIAGVVTWIVLSALLVTIICVNSSRLSRLEEEENYD